MTERQKLALVTGAANGIGYSIALRLAVAGYRVLAADLDERKLDDLTAHAGAEGGVVIPVLLDCSREDAIADVVREQLAEPGLELDVLVNNAGRGLEKPFFDITLTEWRSIIDLDLTGPFLLARLCWPHLVKPGASIINISSVHASRALPGLAAYAAAKGGLVSLTKALAIDAGPFGVRVNAVMPGFIQTRLWDDWMERAGEDLAQRHRADVSGIVPLGGPGAADDVAGTVLWLAGRDSAYVTGTAIEVDGGMLARAYRLPSLEEPAE